MKKPPRLTPKLRNRIVSLAHDGADLSKIVTETRIPEKVICRWISRGLNEEHGSCGKLFNLLPEKLIDAAISPRSTAGPSIENPRKIVSDYHLQVRPKEHFLEQDKIEALTEFTSERVKGLKRNNKEFRDELFSLKAHEYPGETVAVALNRYLQDYNMFCEKWNLSSFSAPVELLDSSPIKITLRMNPNYPLSTLVQLVAHKIREARKQSGVPSHRIFTGRARRSREIKLKLAPYRQKRYSLERALMIIFPEIKQWDPKKRKRFVERHRIYWNVS